MSKRRSSNAAENLMVADFSATLSKLVEGFENISKRLDGMESRNRLSVVPSPAAAPAVPSPAKRKRGRQPGTGMRKVNEKSNRYTAFAMTPSEFAKLEQDRLSYGFTNRSRYIRKALGFSD